MTDIASGCMTRNSQRLVVMDGVVNFRDLGGYASTDGRITRWGMVFRSDGLSDLSDADVLKLQGLGIRTVCDLRAPSEIASKPNRDLSGISAAYHPMGFMPYRGDELLADTKAGAIAIPEIESRVREIYRRFVTDQTEIYSRFLQMLVNNPLPLLFHCTSGRDRTGFAAAVVLMAVGVPRSAIAEDYALSNNYRRDLTFQIGGAVDADVMRTLTNANPQYLAASFDAIDQGWESDDDYLQRGLRLSDASRARLMDTLLE